MKINTDKIEHILRTKYGWERFPLDEQPENKAEEKKKREMYLYWEAEKINVNDLRKIKR